MKEEWKKVKLGDYIDILSGYAFKTGDFIEKGVPVIKIKNVNPPIVTQEDVSFVSEEIANKCSKYILNYNDVLIAMTGSHINQINSVVGRVARVKYKNKTLLNQRVGKLLITDSAHCNFDFIYHYLSQFETKVRLANIAGGAANQANISPSDIKNLELTLPPLPTQQKIASILSAYDDLIENNRKQIKLLEEAALKLYKEWFVKLNFPGHETTKIADGVPDGWKKGKLSDLGEFKRGKTITKDQTISGSVPVVAGGLEPAYYHNEFNTESPVITVSGSGANAGFTRMYNERVWASDCSFLDSSKCDCLFFIYCVLKSSTAIVDSLQKGAAQPHVYAKDINALEILIPNKDILEKFEKLTKPYFNKIKNCQLSIVNLQLARDKLLPKLMNGEIEV